MRAWPLWMAILASAIAAPAGAGEVKASPPTALSVTVYRDPGRASGSIRLERLGGFALVTETRTVRLPAGESRLSFEGVVDGIQAESAILTGLPGGVIEKNRDAALLSPEALMRAAVGAEITLVRTDRRTGKVTRVPATLRSANEAGAVFETAQGIEALRCSGLPERFSYERLPAGLTAVPTLSVLTRTAQPVEATVTLSYLTWNFDWAADYVARINPDGRSLNLAGWITLANGNGVSLADARTQVVAGKLKHGRDGVAASWDQPYEIARCWPQGTTSDIPLEAEGGADKGKVVVTARRVRGAFYEDAAMAMPAPPPRIAPRPPEQLGDLKLYRLAQPTTVAARQSKQVRLLDQADVPFTRVVTADLPAIGAMPFRPASVLLRTQNSLADHLGLPLPAGGMTVFQPSGPRALLVGQPALHDTAVDEEIELALGQDPDIQVRQTRLQYVAQAPEILALSPELQRVLRQGQTVEQVEITNAAPTPTDFELRLRPYGALQVVKADQPMMVKDGRPLFRLTVPANGAMTVHYQVAR